MRGEWGEAHPSPLSAAWLAVCYLEGLLFLAFMCVSLHYGVSDRSSDRRRLWGPVINVLSGWRWWWRRMCQPQLLYIQSKECCLLPTTDATKKAREAKSHSRKLLFQFRGEEKKASKHPSFSSTGCPDLQISQSTPSTFTPSQPRIAPLQRATPAKDVGLVCFWIFWIFNFIYLIFLFLQLRSWIPVSRDPLAFTRWERSNHSTPSRIRLRFQKHQNALLIQSITSSAPGLLACRESELSVPLHWSTSANVRPIRIWR